MSMSTAPASTSFASRLRQAWAAHVQNLRAVLRQLSPWMLLVPLAATGGIAIVLNSPAGWLTDKITQEIVGPSILAVAALVALVFWVETRHFYGKCLFLLSGALFCRELHFWGTNDGIYLMLILIFWHASSRFEATKPFTADRSQVNLLVCALWTYFITKTFDRAWWWFLPGWKNWHDNLEETLESFGHLTILMLAATCYLRFGSLLRLTAAQQSTLRARFTRMAVATAVVISGAVVYVQAAHVSLKKEAVTEKPPKASAFRSDAGFPLEISDLCNVNPRLGPNLFLASSDEQSKIFLWTMDADSEPAVVKELALKVPQHGDEPYHLDDLEALAWDGDETYYAVGSHRHLLPEEQAERMAHSHGSESALVAFELAQADDGIVITNARTVTKDLLTKIRELGVFPSIDWTCSKSFYWRGLTNYWQLDIEGLACVDGKLLLGFKEPIVDGRATILSYDPATDQLSIVARPDLGGQGILSLHYDPASDRLLLLSNNFLKHSYGDSCLWIGSRGQAQEGWTFSRDQRYVVEPAIAKMKRKASGVTVHQDKVAVCFDSETEATIKVIALDKILPKY